MRHFKGETFDGHWRQIPPGFDGAVFERCTARSVHLGSIGDAVRDGRSVVRDVTVRRCKGNALTVGPLVLQRCLFERLTSSRHAVVFLGTAFVACRFEGACGRVSILDSARLAMSARAWFEQIEADNARIHATADFAIDISAATFAELDLRSIPAQAIRVNGVDQVAFDRERVCRFLLQPGDTAQALVDWLRIRVDTCPYDYVEVAQRSRTPEVRARFGRLLQLARDQSLLLT